LQDLTRYYECVSRWILPHLRARPLDLSRYPRVPMPARGGFIVADTLPDVLRMVRLGVIELHTWGSRADEPTLPDRVTFDLDPDPALPWARVVEGALVVRTLLSELALESYPKTTGGRGVHIVAPVKPEHSWRAVRDFARRVAQYLAATLPGQFTAHAAKAQRKGRIFIDWLRNQRGATTVAAYSVRARGGGTVSVPLAWKELSAKLKPQGFDLRSVPVRLERLADDPWEGYAEQQRLARALERMP
jgi:bifunctional non-homologous end joining protein LigD